MGENLKTYIGSKVTRMTQTRHSRDSTIETNRQIGRDVRNPFKDRAASEEQHITLGSS